jgi:hypothetical protein
LQLKATKNFDFQRQRVTVFTTFEMTIN